MKHLHTALVLIVAAAPIIELACNDGDGAATTASASHGATATSSGSSSSMSSSGSGGAGGGAAITGTPIPADKQRTGDAAKGYTALVNNGYVSCGVPWSAYSAVYGPAPADQQIPGRTGKNATLPDFYTETIDSNGVDLVAPNCLSCHAGHIAGKLVIGLGAADADFTVDPSNEAQAVGFLLSDPKEKAEWHEVARSRQDDWPVHDALHARLEPGRQSSRHSLRASRSEDARVVGHAALAASAERAAARRYAAVVAYGEEERDVLFGGGRGDHARIMMTASTLCTDSVAEAQAIDAYFPDIEAYITSIKPPAYPFPIDAALAMKGAAVFSDMRALSRHLRGESHVSEPPRRRRRHRDRSAPRARRSGFAKTYVDWFNSSFYGMIAHLDPQSGYVAPPLDGIWATAPFLHNGSVPTIDALLDSTKRPKFWTRSFDSNDYDPVALGWKFTALAAGKDAEPDATKKKAIYDTTLSGYGNGGHTFGDALSDADRAAVIEYLKTL